MPCKKNPPVPRAPSSPYPAPPKIERRWTPQNEGVDSYGNRRWACRDLRAVVANQPVFDLPLSLIPLDTHKFDCPNLVEFAEHMKHCQEADLDDPIIMDELGSIVDGRHRIVRALLEGRHSLPCKKIPNGTLPTSTN